MLIKGTAQQLAEAMANISQQYYKENWAMGLEFELWNEITGTPSLLSQEEADKLHELVERCQGWIRMNYSTDNLEFVSQNTWIEIYTNENPYEF